MFNFESLKKSISEITTEKGRLTKRLEKLKQEREEILSAPLCDDEVIAALCADVDRLAGTYDIEVAWSDIRNKPNADRQFPFRFLHAGPYGGSDVTLVREEAVAFWFGDHLKERITEAVRAKKFTVPGGLPLSEREAAVTKIDREIDEVEANLRRLDNEAKSAGITL